MKMRSLGSKLAAHAVVWSCVWLIATGSLDRALMARPAHEPARYALVPTNPMQSAVETLSEVCVGLRKEPRSGPAYDLLPEWDELACQRASGGVSYSKMFMLPKGSRLDVLVVSPGFTLNMGVGAASKTYTYDAGGGEILRLGDAASEGRFGRPGAEVPCEPHPEYSAVDGVARNKCRALFRHVDQLDDHPEGWTVFYEMARDTKHEWALMRRAQ